MLINMNGKQCQVEHIFTFSTYVSCACVATALLGSVGLEGHTSVDAMHAQFIATGAHADRAQGFEESRAGSQEKQEGFHGKKSKTPQQAAGV